MSRENQKTLQVYEKYYRAYLEGEAKREKARPGKTKKEARFVDEGFKSLPRPTRILEIGSGSGLMAKALSSLGYLVTPSDAVEGFLQEMRKNGLQPIKYNVLTDEGARKYDGVLAWRVFVHFTREDLEMALAKILELLRLGGRLVLSVQDGNAGGEWVDYGGDYQMGAKRFFQYYAEENLRELVEQAGFRVVILKAHKSNAGIKWLYLVAEKPLGVRPELQEYIEAEILPRYRTMIGHQENHIRAVMARSLNFAEQINREGKQPIDYNMCYIVAAFHDLGRAVDPDTHEKISAKLLLEDKKLPEYFTKDQLKIMAEAVEDHRASAKHEPRGIYGRIVASADRDNDAHFMVKKAFKIFSELFPDSTEEENLERARVHLLDKYTPTGYAASKMYFDDPDFTNCLEEIEELAMDLDKFREVATT